MKPMTVTEWMEKARGALDALGVAHDSEAIADITRAKHARTDTYDVEASACFLKTKQENGGLSNMAGGYPIRVFLTEPAGSTTIRDIRSTEALYQACRFPDHPEIQQEIIDNKSPMGAKMVAKREKSKSREDWLKINVDVMWWCLTLKWNMHPKFRDLLAATGDKPIVEISYKDPFWGAKPDEDGHLIGQNILGKLLMELRGYHYPTGTPSRNQTYATPISNFKLLGMDIE